MRVRVDYQPKSLIRPTCFVLGLVLASNLSGTFYHSKSGHLVEFETVHRAFPRTGVKPGNSPLSKTKPLYHLELAMILS